MRVLALDTALANCAAAVFDDSTETPCLCVQQEQIGRGHAEMLMGMIGDVMAEASTAFTDLDRIVVTKGPGSFTGLRVGLSVARGFGLVLDKPVVGITTLESIARTASKTCSQLPLLVALPGKGQEIYAQLFDGNGAAMDAPSVRNLEDLPNAVSAGTRLAGAAAEAVRAACAFSEEAVIGEQAYPDIAEVAKLGILANPLDSAASPLYLRPPDATPQKKGRIERLPERAN
ncbi:tRNA (adenosine(37)-N6)-threonylcarbamoyltransferase complex dimerization subunit type 1 TsaB [Roseibium sp. RKSG952]|uniref:tRNA (adenosine(37)-N6)-threonylcarbamoyltransferase complex dimerization subunit type 1 TsaB n=1 Tax=Roseibium sp. RKSG952 TaxID=2529384 RepID=UPI0012BCA7AB|nr:tRNA (adenosine(37)-N6)-threonylcarbamoyltransferase complex dimerization subunit type 1 TsaB [Roseibium sp. RKSG952]MTH99737.1 tRNA (adenosine(37)-N6)-threonylcarbamoyltransferase complex dimerization subunit type 1 TsaB [Roseibium sp. RKSG952]